MTTIASIGLDLAKKVFQIHGVDADGKVIVARKLRRKEVLVFFSKLAPCLVGMEACGSAHYWAREIAKLGHTVKLLPPKYVKAYVKRGQPDAIDADLFDGEIQQLSGVGTPGRRGGFLIEIGRGLPAGHGLEALLRLQRDIGRARQAARIEGATSQNPRDSRDHRQAAPRTEPCPHDLLHAVPASCRKREIMRSRNEESDALRRSRAISPDWLESGAQ